MYNAMVCVLPRNSVFDDRKLGRKSICARIILFYDFVRIVSCPAPLKNRDFVLQRSWLDTGDEKMILNHSVFHKDYPPRKGYVRAMSLLTGFVVRTRCGLTGSWLGYVSRSDPRGALPAWLVNRVTAQLAPRLVQQLHAAARRYPGWKALTDLPYHKPWRHPDQVPPYRISLED
ncbi:PCTP-like protein, partial [Operophtera brumata]